GVFGSGNTGDLTIQLQFAKTNAISFIKAVDPKTFANFVNDPALKNLYLACRDSMFAGAVRTEFAIVEEIPDDNDHHAVMRRVGTTIEVSRRQMQGLLAAGLLTAPALTAHILHEVA